MAVKQLKIPNVGDSVLYHMNGVVRPAVVVTWGDSETTYVGLSVQTASDGSPEALDKCAPIFYAYAPHGEVNGYWQWREEMNYTNIVVGVDETGQVVKAEPVPVTQVEQPVVEDVPTLPIGVNGAVQADSALGKILISELLTIRTAIAKMQMILKNGRVTLAGTDVDQKLFNEMLAAAGVSCENVRSILFGVTS